MQSQVAGNIAQMTARIRMHPLLPVAVGFGISTPEQARLVGQSADAVVVGSAIVSRIARLGKTAGMVEDVTAYVSSLATALKGQGEPSPA